VLSGCAVCGGNQFRKSFEKQGWDFVKCLSCGVMTLDPLPTLEQLYVHYKSRTSSGNYEMEMDHERELSVSATLDYIAASSPQRAPISFLDIGCFDGQLMNLAKRKFGWDCWGIDLNEEAIQAAKKNHGNQVACTTIEDYSPPAGHTFDVVTAIAVIEHLREPQNLMPKISRWLANDGICVIECPNVSSGPARVLGRYWPPFAAPEHIFYFGPKHVRMLAEKSGLRFIKSNRDWKRLSVRYVYRQMQFWGPELRPVVGALFRLLPGPLRDLRLPLYGGEMFVVLRKQSS
jgi:2-polyprenyl-3-methyl-5-hydroxy-6-metoxy-1,4-benzoquinol methylase